MKNSIIYIFICLFCVLLMSHNANAVSSVIDLSQYTPITRQVYSTVDCKINSTELSSVSQCGIAGSGNYQLNSLFTHNEMSFNKGDIIEFDIVSNTAAYGAVGSTISAFGYQAFKPIDPDIFYLYGIEQVSNESFLSQFGNSSHFGNVNSVLHVMFYVASDVRTKVGFVATDLTFNPIAYWSQVSSTAKLEWNIINLVKWRKTSKSNINQEQEQATQNAANNSATSGNNSTSNSQNATSSLLSVITSGIGAITSASPTNCKINGNMGNLNVGNIDLCANPVPTFMTLIGSIIAVLVVLPLVILLFNRFISIIRSFQR